MILFGEYLGEQFGSVLNGDGSTAYAGPTQRFTCTLLAEVSG
ncbi:MAG: hypothetical protein ACRC3H_21325 [Lachnospiraceae bacterium]